MYEQYGTDEELAAECRLVMAVVQHPQAFRELPLVPPPLAFCHPLHAATYYIAVGMITAGTWPTAEVVAPMVCNTEGWDSSEAERQVHDLFTRIEPYDFDRLLADFELLNARCDSAIALIGAGEDLSKVVVRH